MVEIPQDELQRLPGMLWRAGPDMSCEFISRQWLEFTGYEEAQALGDGWSRAVHPEDLPRWLDTCLRAFDTREPYELECRLRRRDGEYRWVLERGTPRHSSAGAFLGFTGVCLDIDERKQAERELERARERERRWRTEAASPAHGGLLAGVRVLIVDEDPAARDSIARVLAIAGAQTHAARSIPEAIDAVAAFRPDVILSGVGVDQGHLDVRAARERERDTQIAKPVEPLALLATVARVAQPARV